MDSDGSESEGSELRTHVDRAMGIGMGMERSLSSRETLPTFTYRTAPPQPSNLNPGHTERMPRDPSRRRSYPRDRRLSAQERVQQTGKSTDQLVRLLLQEERESKSIKKVLMEAMERIGAENRRAEEAERRTEEAMARLRVVNEARLAARQEVERANKELQLYKMQYFNAQSEIDRAQAIINQVERQRSQAEADAHASRAKARRLREQHLLDRARDEGHQQGFAEGLQRGRGLAQQEPLADGPLPREDGERVWDDEDLVPTEPNTPTPLYSGTPPGSVRGGGAAQAPNNTAPDVAPPPSPSPAPSVPLEHNLNGAHPGAIHPTIIHNMPRSPQHSVYEVPPDNYIPTMDEGQRIRLPPPHEMGLMPTSPGVTSTTLPPVPAPPQPAPSSASSHGHSHDTRSGGHRRRQSESSLGSGTTLSQMDLLGGGRQSRSTRQPRDSRLSAIIETSSTHNSPATPGRQSIGPDQATRQSPRVGDVERPYSNPRIVEQWAANSTPPGSSGARPRSSASRRSVDQTSMHAPVGRQGGLGLDPNRMDQYTNPMRPSSRASDNSDSSSVSGPMSRGNQRREADRQRERQNARQSRLPGASSSQSSAVEITIQPPSRPPSESGGPPGGQAPSIRHRSSSGSLSPVPEHGSSSGHGQRHGHPPSPVPVMPPGAGPRVPLYPQVQAQARSGGVSGQPYIQSGFPGGQPHPGAGAGTGVAGGANAPIFPPSAPGAPVGTQMPSYLWQTGPPFPGQPGWPPSSGPQPQPPSQHAQPSQPSHHPQPHRQSTTSSSSTYDAANPFAGPRPSGGAGPNAPVFPPNFAGATFPGFPGPPSAPGPVFGAGQGPHPAPGQAPGQGRVGGGSGSNRNSVYGAPLAQGGVGMGISAGPGQGPAPAPGIYGAPFAPPPRSPSSMSNAQALPIPMRSASPTPIRVASPAPIRPGGSSTFGGARVGTPSPGGGGRGSYMGNATPIPIPAPGPPRGIPPPDAGRPASPRPSVIGGGSGNGRNNIVSMHAQVYSPSGYAHGNGNGNGHADPKRPALRHSHSGASTYSDSRFAPYVREDNVEPAFYAAPPSPALSRRSSGSASGRTITRPY